MFTTIQKIRRRAYLNEYGKKRKLPRKEAKISPSVKGNKKKPHRSPPSQLMLKLTLIEDRLQNIPTTSQVLTLVMVSTIFIIGLILALAS